MSAGHRVQIRVYDLTRGMASVLGELIWRDTFPPDRSARASSLPPQDGLPPLVARPKSSRCSPRPRASRAPPAPSLIGQSVEGIWHSGIVVFGREWFFGSGVQQAGEHEFPAMYSLPPSRTLELGWTEVPAEIFEAWVAEQGLGQFCADGYHLIRNNCNHFADEAAHFLTGSRMPPEIAAQAASLLALLLRSPAAPLVLPMLQGLGGPLGQLIPSVDVAELASASAAPRAVAAPTGTATGTATTAAAAATATTGGTAIATAGATAAAAVQVKIRNAIPVSSARLRVLGDKARPLLSTEGGAQAVARLLAAAQAAESGCDLTDTEAAAVQAALPSLLARAAVAEAPAPLVFPRARAATAALSEQEAAALRALGRCLLEWPAHRLATVAFLVRSLVLLPEAQPLLLEEGRCMHALVSRALGAASAPPPSAAVQALGMSALANCLALHKLHSHVDALLDELLDACVRVLKADTSSDGARLIAAAALYNLTLQLTGIGHEEQRTLLLCALCDELGLERTAGELALRLLRAVGQLLVWGGPEALELAFALGMGEHTAELAEAGDADLAADLRVLLRGEAGAQ